MPNKYIIARAILAMTTQLPAVFCGDNFSAEEKTHLAGILGEENINVPYLRALNHLKNYLGLNDPTPLQIEVTVNLQVLGLEQPTPQHIRAYYYLHEENIAPTFFRILGTSILFEQNVNHPTLKKICSYSEPMEHLHTIGCDYTNPTFIEFCRYIRKRGNLPTTERQIKALGGFCDLPIFEKNLSFEKKIQGICFNPFNQKYFTHICDTLIHIEDVLKLRISPKLLKDCSIIMAEKKEEPSMEILGLLSWCRLHDVDFCLGSSVKMLTVLNFLKDAKMNISDPSEEEIKFGICSQSHQTNDNRQLYFDSEQLKKWKAQRQLEAKWFESAYCVYDTLELPLSEDIIRKLLGADSSSFSLCDKSVYKSETMVEAFACLFEKDKMLAYFFEQRKPLDSYQIAAATHCLHLGLKPTNERLEACKYLFKIGLNPTNERLEVCKYLFKTKGNFPSKYKIDALAYPNGEKLNEYDCYNPKNPEEVTLCYAYMDMTLGKGLSEDDFKQLVELNNSLKEWEKPHISENGYSNNNKLFCKNLTTSSFNFDDILLKLENVDDILLRCKMEMTNDNFNAFRKKIEGVQNFLYMPDPEMTLIQVLHCSLYAFRYIRESLKLKPTTELISACVDYHCYIGKHPSFEHLNLLSLLKRHAFKSDLFFRTFEYLIKAQFNMAEKDEAPMFFGQCSFLQEKSEIKWFGAALEIVEERFHENKKIRFPSKREIQKKIAIKQKLTQKWSNLKQKTRQEIKKESFYSLDLEETDKDSNEDSTYREDEAHDSPHMESID